MYRLHLTAEDLARTRIAARPSPFDESIHAVERLRQRTPGLLFRAWRTQLNGRLGRATRVLAEVFPAVGSGVDLATLVGPVDDLREGLDRLAGAPAEGLRRELEWYGRRHRLTAWARSLADRDPGPRLELVAAVAALHDAAIRPYWARIDELIGADRAARARAVAAGGLEQLLATLCPAHVRWRHPVLSVDTPPGCDADVHLDGRGLVLTPSVFIGDLPCLAFDLADPGAPATLIYPVVNDLAAARRLWTADRPPGHLATLLGRSRSALLETIADGCGTVELARRVGLSPASVSEHTAVLRNSGLISTRRDGARVVHAVTNLGAMLLDGEQARTASTDVKGARYDQSPRDIPPAGERRL
ncbi:helix-turn-helix domain-containing protein [Actinoplanes sp. NPDC023714]|uniref:helix-turn-helix domain-containing protein n=1 Tax=Actinoplanes sp. NPDC023714 TaxID=3154322 RepID=UPI0033F4B5BF